MKRLFILLCFVSSFSVTAQQLSDKAEISVITCGPWQRELYSTFGHSAFRVVDTENNIDYAYNYGIFDFGQPNFYLNFAKGYLYYRLGVYYYKDFKNDYIYDNRYVHEQVLNLLPRQKQALFNYLQWNARPENQHYRYDYFYNNCATKMPDIVSIVLKDSVNFDGSYITNPSSFRVLTDLYLEHQPWGDLGIDICLGLPMDKVASPYEHMFLPDYVESGFDHATLKRPDGEVALVKNKNIVYESRPEDPPSGLPHPLYVFTAAAIGVLALSMYDYKRKKVSNWLDALLFGAIGLIGLLLLLLWIATDHQAASKNFNLLWALPTHVIAAASLFTNAAWVKKYFLGAGTLMILLLVFWSVLPQTLNTALIPVVVILGARSFIQFLYRKK